MRVAQHRILSKLLDYAVIPEYIYAFEKDKSIPVMAQKHVEKKLVISIDLKDFFHSITQKMLFDALERMGVTGAAARTVSELCTYKFFVPQGALTSPKVANIISAHTFGPVVKEYCDSKGLDLTIYADDLTISTNAEVAPAEIITEVSNFIRAAGFRVNREKTKVMKSNRRQYVCGVVVNKKTNLMKKERNRLRAMVHNVVKNGIEAEAARSNVSASTYTSQLKGKVNWFRQLNVAKGQILMDKLQAYEASIKEEKALENILEPLTTYEESTEAAYEISEAEGLEVLRERQEDKARELLETVREYSKPEEADVPWD
jgi:RNA-directed DNA polymerase